MGLDVVELVMRAEEEFGIELKDEDCAFISTCGQFCSLIERELGLDMSEKERRCASQRAFYEVRRELMALTGRGRREITPRSLLQDLIPAKNRGTSWNKLREKLNFYLPDLERPENIVTLFNWWATLSILLVLVSGPLHIPWSFAVSCSGICFLAFCLSRPLAIVPPIGVRTVGEIALQYAPRYVLLAPTKPTRDMWPQVQKLIADELSVPIEKVTREADLIRDLGVD